MKRRIILTLMLLGVLALAYSQSAPPHRHISLRNHGCRRYFQRQFI
jgi:hypothetical protein